MKKKLLLMPVVGMVLAAASVPVVAQEVKGNKLSQNTTLPITAVTETTDGNLNYKNFHVEASEAGAYYTEFWLLPSRYPDNSYSTFKIYLNRDYIGSINPSVGNWQSARVEGHETLELSEGVNVITIATHAPEFPEVETLKVSMNDADAVFSSAAYEEYLANAAAGVPCDDPEEYGGPLYVNGTTNVGLDHFSNMPLNYTFYKTFSFTKNQEIYVTSSSSAKHKIDIIYFGSKTIPGSEPGTGDFPSFPIGYDSTSQNRKPSAFYGFPYTPATSEEMQGLSWIHPSEKTLNSSTQVATARLTIPKSGIYLIRVRHTQNGETGVADVNVNGAYFYENIPISLSYRDCSIPADGNTYATFTCCNNFGTDDPFLFIHGGDCDKIVGFNDDGPASKIEQYELSPWDSYISQRYFMKTNGISVSNFSSSNPKSRCNVVARLSEGAAQSLEKSRGKGGDTAGTSYALMINESVTVEVPGNLSGSFSIAANESIGNVYAYGLAGDCIGSVSGSGLCIEIPASSLNITRPGIYIISVETENGVTSRKVAVK